MKIYEVMGQQVLQIEKDDDRETVLVDPKSKVKTIVPKDPTKPGAISKDDRGNLTLDQTTKGTVGSRHQARRQGNGQATMKLNELITDFTIYLTNEEKSLLETVNGLTPLNKFQEREQVIIDNLIRKSVLTKVMYNNQIMVMTNDY